MRTEKLVRYLPEFGWSASVLCRNEGMLEDADGRPGATRARVVRLRSPVPPWLSYQFAAWAWAGRILPRARALLRDCGADLVYASCPPFAHALSALHLGRDAGIPVVVDFRDAWSLDPHFSGGLIKQAAKCALCRWVYPRFERRVIERADAVIMNTPSMRRAYARLLQRSEQSIALVPNGFDEVDFRAPVERRPRERPSLLHCGRLSGIGGRSPELLLRAVRSTIDAGRHIELEILGDDSEAIRRAVRRHGLEGSVRARAAVSNPEAVRAMREADILVLYQSPSRNDVTPVAGKTFEYLRSGRPILAVVPAGDNADLVRRYAAVHAIVSGDDPAQLAAAIDDLLARIPKASSPPDPEFVERYARRHVAERIAGIFDAAVKGAHRG